MGSQSHKCGCLCGANPREKESVDLELARGRVIMLLLEVKTCEILKYLQVYEPYRSIV